MPGLFVLFSQNLEKALLTHSFHCCAFKFPSRHDPLRHGEHIDQIEKQKKEFNCKDKDKTQSPTSSMRVARDNLQIEDGSFKGSSNRKRRNVIRWIRSDAPFENSTGHPILLGSHTADETENSFGGEGEFHKVAILHNNYLEAMCGTLSSV